MDDIRGKTAFLWHYRRRYTVARRWPKNQKNEVCEFFYWQLFFALSGVDFRLIDVYLIFVSHHVNFLHSHLSLNVLYYLMYYPSSHIVALIVTCMWFGYGFICAANQTIKSSDLFERLHFCLLPFPIEVHRSFSLYCHTKNFFWEWTRLFEQWERFVLSANICMECDHCALT